jgi:hypothetical protein
MAAKQLGSTEEVRRRIQRGVSRMAKAEKAAQDPTKRDIARDKEFDALSVPKGGRTVRKRPTGPLRHWPSPSSTKGDRT